MMSGPDETCPKLAQLTDRYGNTIHYGNAGDFWFPAFPIGQDTDYRTHVRRIRDMAIRPDDVLICSYPKTGLHWTAEMVLMLMRKSAQHTDASAESQDAFLDMRPMDEVERKTSPRLLVTHLPFRYVPKQALEKKIKIIQLDRNPKDVLVSYYCHVHSHLPPLEFPGSFEQFFRFYYDCGYIYGDMFDYLMAFQEGMEAYPDVNVFTSVYEDMKQDPVTGVAALNEYLATGCSQELCQQIAEACSFEVLKPVMDSKVTESTKARFKEGKPAFYRKGHVGDWKNWFTVAMNEEFEELYKKRMSGYKRTYKYALLQDDL